MAKNWSVIYVPGISYHGIHVNGWWLVVFASLFSIFQDYIQHSTTDDLVALDLLMTYDAQRKAWQQQEETENGAFIASPRLPRVNYTWNFGWTHSY